MNVWSCVEPHEYVCTYVNAPFFLHETIKKRDLKTNIGITIEYESTFCQGYSGVYTHRMYETHPPFQRLTTL